LLESNAELENEVNLAAGFDLHKKFFKKPWDLGSPFYF
jgi:hypothetical protein